MGDYSGVANPNTIMQQRYGDATAQYQLAELVGVRFVSVSETKRGVELEEAVVKQITGNDTISARAPYGKPFTYRPQFKLWLSTNHKPEIPDGSEAIWDRMRLIPFTQRFDGKTADPDLPEKLREELPGVLAWAVRGCVEWNANGLGTAKAVEKATAEYRSETDVLDRFFEDECEFGPTYQIEKKVLFDAWERWCDAEGVDAGTQTTFTRTVKERGITRGFSEKKVKGTRVWEGIRLVIPPSDSPSAPSQKSCKHIGITDSRGHFPPDLENLSLGASREGEFEKTAMKCPQVPPGEIIPPSAEELDDAIVIYTDERGE
jgi:putative DNA primase/helicase